MCKPDSTCAVDELPEPPARDAAAAAAGKATTQYLTLAQPIVYRKPAAAELPSPYTLLPRVAALRHSQCLIRCVVGIWRKAG